MICSVLSIDFITACSNLNIPEFKLLKTALKWSRFKLDVTSLSLNFKKTL